MWAWHLWCCSLPSAICSPSPRSHSYRPPSHLQENNATLASFATLYRSELLEFTYLRMSRHLRSKWKDPSHRPLHPLHPLWHHLEHHTPQKISQTLKMFIYEEPQVALNLCRTILSKWNVPPWPLFTRILRSDGSVSKGGPLGQERSNVTHVTLKFSKKATGAPLMHWPSTFCGRNIIEALVLATYIIMWTILSKTNKWLAWGIVKYWSFGM